MPEKNIADMQGKDLISGIKQEITKHDNGRQMYKRQAMQNVLFLYGRHYHTISKNHFSNELIDTIAADLEARSNRNKIQRTSNYILPLYRSLLARLQRQQANIHAKPTTSQESDRDAARVSKEVAEHFWQNCNRSNPWTENGLSGMQMVLLKLNTYQLTLGGGYLIPVFNPKALDFMYNDVTGSITEAEVGAVEVRVESPLNIFRDRFGRWVIHRRHISPEQVFYEFDKDVDPEPQNDDLIESRILMILEGAMQEEKKEGVYVYDKYCLPTKDYPEGRLISVGGETILRDDILPPEYKKRLPPVQILYQDLGFSPLGQGAIEQAIDSQRDYNETLTRISQYKRNLTGKVLAPRGANLSAKYDDQVGQIVYHSLGFRPTMENGASIPAYFFKEIERIRRDMEDVMSSHDTSIGRTPKGVKSGVGIDALSENDMTQIAPELVMQERKLGYFTETVLDIMVARYQERRLLDISGEDLAYEMKSFIGSDLMGQKKIEIRLGSSLPAGKEARQAFIMNLADRGYISQARAKELLEFADVEGIYKTLDEIGAKNDLLNIIEDNGIVIAEPWEDHTIRLKVINDFRKGSTYAKLDEQKRAAINDLARQHGDYLLLEQQAAAQQGGALPAAAQPQGVG